METTMRIELAAALVLAAAVAGCGTTSVYRPSSQSKFDLDPAAEINDEDVRKAFSAQAQLGKSLKVAFFTFESKRIGELDSMIQRLPRVDSTYPIPALLVTGQRRFEGDRPWDRPRTDFSIKKLRLLAARARCDVLLVVDYGTKVTSRPNAAAIANILLVPVLFLPYLDVKVESYLEGFLLDTRNGYLYGQVLSQQDEQVKYQTIYSVMDRVMLERQWKWMLKDFGGALERIITTPPPKLPAPTEKAVPPPKKPVPPPPGG
jgi:hypothetical protein